MPKTTTRRAVLATGAGTIAAAIASSAAASPLLPHSDAALIALRDRWRAARAAFAAAQPPRSPEYEAALASLPTLAGITDGAEKARIIRARCVALDEIEARLGGRLELTADEREREDQAFEEDCEAVREMIDTPARTLAGLAIKAEVSTVEGHLDTDLVASIMADIIAMGGANA